MRFNHEAVIVSPDAGGVERARAYSKRLGASLAIIDKRRPAPNVSEVMNIIGDVKGKRRDHRRRHGRHRRHAVRGRAGGHGAGRPRRCAACASHGVLSRPAIERIKASPLTELIVTDTIPLRPDVRRLPEDQGPQRRAPARRGGQAHPPRRFDQLAVHLTGRKEPSVMEFAKLNVECQDEPPEGRRAQGSRRGQGPGRALRAQARADRRDVQREGAARRRSTRRSAATPSSS